MWKRNVGLGLFPVTKAGVPLQPNPISDAAPMPLSPMPKLDIEDSSSETYFLKDQVEFAKFI